MTPPRTALRATRDPAGQGRLTRAAARAWEVGGYNSSGNVTAGATFVDVQIPPTPTPKVDEWLRSEQRLGVQLRSRVCQANQAGADDPADASAPLTPTILALRKWTSSELQALGGERPPGTQQSRSC